MKNILSFILLTIALAAAAQAQTTVAGYPLEKGFNMMSADATHVLGECGGEVVAVAHVARGVITLYKDYEVLAIDKTGAIRSVELPDTKHCDLLAATLVDGQVHVLMAGTDKNQFSISRAAVNVAGMKITTPLTPIYSETLAKSDLPYYLSAQSPSGDFVALYAGIYRNASKDFRAKEVLLDNTLGELWTKQYPLAAVNALRVTDDGQVQTMSYYCNEKENRSGFRFGLLDENGEDVQETTFTSTKIENCRLLNCINGKFVVAGLLVDKKNSGFSGLCGLAYDMKSRDARMSTSPFTDEEANVLENRPLRSNMKRSAVTAGLTPMSSAATDFGGACSFSRIYTVTTTGAGAPNSTDYYVTGTLAVAVDTDGHIMWRKPFRMAMKEPEHTYFIHAGLCAKGSTVYLVQSEPAKGGLVYDIAATAKMKAVNGFKARTAVYAISPKGEVGKEMFGEASKQKVVSPLMPAGDGKYWFLTSMLSQSALHKITL